MDILCKVENCQEKVHSKIGYCLKHYACWKRTGDPIPKRPQRKSCSVDGCLEKHRRNGYCDMHSIRMYRHGDLDTHFHKKYNTDQERHMALKKSKRKYRATLRGQLAGRLKRQRRRHLMYNDIKITATQVEYLLNLFNNQCFKCESKEDLTLDHNIPLIQGGLLELTNTTILCRSCNGKKSDVSPSDWYTSEELKRLGDFKMKIQDDLDKRPTIYFLFGAFGSGKSWISDQVRDKYEIVDYDDYRDESIEMIDYLTQFEKNKKVMYVSSIMLAPFINKNSMKYNIVSVAIIESEETIKARLINRGGTWTDNVKKRMDRIKKIANKYAIFSGNSEEVLAFLQRL